MTTNCNSNFELLNEINTYLDNRNSYSEAEREILREGFRIELKSA